MTTTNYLSPEDFKKMVDAIPLVTEYNKSKLIGIQKNRVPNPKILQYANYTQFCHGLRVSELKRLTKLSFNFDRNILSLTHTKTGFKKKEGKKVRKTQYTSIPPDFPKEIIEWISSKNDDEILFPFTRQLMWSYGKKAAAIAKLELGEQQDERYIEGFWTHLIRKSRAKMMIEKGASEVMVKVKLRHTFTVTERYTKPDINALIEWEKSNLS